MRTECALTFAACARATHVATAATLRVVAVCDPAPLITRRHRRSMKSIAIEASPFPQESSLLFRWQSACHLLFHKLIKRLCATTR